MSEATSSAPGVFKPWLRASTIVGLVLISLLTTVNSAVLLRLVEHVRANTQEARVQAMSARIVELQQQIDTLKNQPRPLSLASFATVRQGMEDRLTEVEQVQETCAQSVDLQVFRSRLEQIEARLKKARQPVLTKPAHKNPEGAPQQKPSIQAPPFKTIGIELRGGERFLAIAARGAASLEQVHLLRVGEAEGAWLLEGIEAQAAVFRTDGQIRRFLVE